MFCYLVQGESVQAARITELEKRAANLESELATKTKQAHDAAESAKDKQQKLDQAIGVITKSKESFARKKGELEAAHRASEAAEAKAQRCDADMEKLQAANTQLSEDKQRLQAQLDELRATDQQLQNRLQVLAALCSGQLGCHVLAWTAVWCV